MTASGENPPDETKEKLTDGDANTKWLVRTATGWVAYELSAPKQVTGYALTSAKNPEILVGWQTLAVEAGYEAVLPRVEEVLGQTGRMKYLKPLYRALAGRPETKPLARTLFAKLQRQYHPIAQQVVGGLLK